MNTQELLDAITRLPQRRSDVPTPPPIELVALMVRWNRSLHQWKTSTLADFARVSVSSVERIERGEKVTDEVLDKIAQAFGYNIGHFTKPRIPLSEDEAMSSLVDTYGHLEAVRVFPMKTHRAVREAAKCDAILIHRPEVPETYDADVENLKEWLDLASFVLSDFAGEPSTSERGRRDLYNDILACVRELERRGLTVLSGVMSAPQDRLPDWKVAIVSVTPKLSDPGAAKRQYVMVDRRVVAFRRNSDAM
jgi:transcriptional regulator with XRE-family HTH domain